MKFPPGDLNPDFASHIPQALILVELPPHQECVGVEPNQLLILCNCRRAKFGANE